MKMNFGRYIHQEMSAVPMWYLKLCLQGRKRWVDKETRAGIKAYIEQHPERGTEAPEPQKEETESHEDQAAELKEEKDESTMRVTFNGNLPVEFPSVYAGKPVKTIPVGELRKIMRIEDRTPGLQIKTVVLKKKIMEQILLRGRKSRHNGAAAPALPPELPVAARAELTAAAREETTMFSVPYPITQITVTLSNGSVFKLQAAGK